MRLSTLRLACALAFSLISTPFAAEAKHKPGVPHIGVLWPIEDERVLDAFRQGLRDLGYVEGENVAFEYRHSHGNAATYVHKVLKDASPAELPIEQATAFELVINMKTARALGLQIPPTVLVQADELLG